MTILASLEFFIAAVVSLEARVCSRRECNEKGRGTCRLACSGDVDIDAKGCKVGGSEYWNELRTSSLCSRRTAACSGMGALFFVFLVFGVIGPGRRLSLSKYECQSVDQLRVSAASYIATSIYEALHTRAHRNNTQNRCDKPSFPPYVAVRFMCREIVSAKPWISL